MSKLYIIIKHKKGGRSHYFVIAIKYSDLRPLEIYRKHSPVIRLRVVPLSLSPLCMTLKKTARKKWPHEILGARSARKEGLPPKPRSLNYMFLSQHKNMIGLC